MTQKTKIPAGGLASSENAQERNLNGTNHNTKGIINHSATAQRQRLMSYLKRYGSITTPESRFNLDIPHPAGRINELRNRGHKIATVMVKDYNPGGTDHYFARYLLKPGKFQEAA